MEPIQIVAIILWALVIIGTIIIELAGPQIVSIWFTLGGLVALILAIFGIEVWIQMVTFVGVSIIALAITKPIYNKYLKKTKNDDRDVNSLVGDFGLIVGIQNNEGRQYVEIKGAKWEIVNEEFIPIGQKVIVTEVIGNKLKVKEK